MPLFADVCLTSPSYIDLFPNDTSVRSPVRCYMLELLCRTIVANSARVASGPSRSMHCLLSSPSGKSEHYIWLDHVWTSTVLGAEIVRLARSIFLLVVYCLLSN